MRPDDILRPSDYEFYRPIEAPPGGFPGYDKPRSTTQLQVDLNIAHDRLKQQVRVNDKLLSQIAKLSKTLEREKQWRNWLLTALILTWTSWAGAIWWASKVLAPVIVKGLSQ